jgi:branched-chain amino acid transport system substrate-binding protein
MLRAVRRILSEALLFGLLSGLAAGCASPPAAPIQPTEAPAEVSTLAPSATAVPLPTDTPFVPKGTVKIAGESPVAYNINFAAQLAVDDLSDPLRALGYAVKFEAFDDNDDLDKAIQIAKDVIADPEVLCLVGPLTSRVTINVSDLYHAAKLPLISPSATSPNVTDRHYPEVNRTTGRNDVMGTAVAKFAADQGFTSAYLVNDDGDFSGQVARAFKAEASKLGVGVLREIKATNERGNQAATAKLVQTDQPQFVFFTGFTWQASPFFKAVREAGYQGVLIAAEPNPDLAQSAGPLALDGGGMYYVSTGAPAAEAGPALEFTRTFRRRFGKEPGPFAGEAYDAAGVCLRAIEEAVKANNGELPTRADVAKAIRLIKDFPGITGTFSIDEHGDPNPTAYYIQQVTHMDPGEWTTNPVAQTYQLPPGK